MITPLPAASTSAFSTAGYDAHARWAIASSRSRNITCEAVGTPQSRISSLAYAFEPSIRAAARVGPNAAMPAALRSSTRPATSGASGPTTTRSTSRSRAASTTSPGGRHSTPSRAMPALPGVASTSGAVAPRRSVPTSACSRPPEPTTRTRLALKARK